LKKSFITTLRLVYFEHLSMKNKAHKRKRKNGLDDPNDDSDADEVDSKSNNLQAILQGASVQSLKKKRKKPTKSEPSQVSLKTIEASEFLDQTDFQKYFWAEDQNNRYPIDEEMKSLRKSIGVNVKGAFVELCPPPVLSMDECEALTHFKEIFTSKSFARPTPVQMQCWSAILSGLNVLGIAPTGSGKTYAYGLPMIPHISAQMPQSNSLKRTCKASPIALVLVPTRELAIQVSAAFKPFKKYGKIQSVAIYGGVNKEVQSEELESNGFTHIIVATPGRLLDTIASGIISLKQVTYFVLDEADRMLAMGFQEQLDMISKQIRPDRQAVLFSATFPGKLRDVATSYIGEAITIRCSTMELVMNNSHEEYLRKKQEKKQNSDSVKATADLSEKAVPIEKDVCEMSAATSAADNKASSLTISDNVVQVGFPFPSIALF
jgi:superfamily II DNA/RNA helicase